MPEAAVMPDQMIGTEIPGIGVVTLAELKAELAWREPQHYGNWTDKAFTRVRHLDYIGKRIAAGIINGGARLIVCAPPRHAKSSLISEKTPQWFLHRWPHKRVILMAYGDDFAETWGRKVRDGLVNARYERKTDTQLTRGADSAVNEWFTTKGGGMRTAGVLGGVLGRGADCLIIDDPVKNSAEAYSPVYQQRLREVYQSTASSRLEPNASVIVTMQRWPSSDFVSWLIEQSESGREKWELLTFPAIAEADDQLGRPVGEPLWPARYDLTALERVRLALEDPAFWRSQWQQAPPEASTEGLAYHAFSAVHSVQACGYNPSLPLIWSLDFNVNPMCSVIAQASVDFKASQYSWLTGVTQDEQMTKTIRILDEIVLPNSNTMEACQRFIQWVEENIPGSRQIALVVYGDSSGHSRKTTGETDYRVIQEQLRRCGRFTYSVRASHDNPAVRDRVTTVNNAFLNAAGQRRLFINPCCKELRKDLGWMRWKSDVAGNPLPDLDKSNAMRSHISDALGYLCWGELKMQAKGGFIGGARVL